MEQPVSCDEDGHHRNRQRRPVAGKGISQGQARDKVRLAPAGECKGARGVGGFGPFDAGGLKMSRCLEAMAIQIIKLGHGQGLGASIGYRLVKEKR